MFYYNSTNDKLFILLYIYIFFILFLYILIKNVHETKIGTIQYESINTPTIMFPRSAPILPNVEPIDTAMPLKKQNIIILSLIVYFITLNVIPIFSRKQFYCNTVH